MPAPGRSRARREHTGQATLSEDAIVATALRILRREGLAAVTMRRVASELGTGAASLYFYVSGRDELCQAMLEAVSEGVPLPAPDAARWREQLLELLESLRRALARHPGLAGEALAHPPADERSLLVTEHVLALLRAGGVADRDAAWACAALPSIAMAAAMSGEPEHDEGGEAFVALSSGRFPNLSALSSQLSAGDASTRLRFTVSVLLDGLLARPA